MLSILVFKIYLVAIIVFGKAIIVYIIGIYALLRDIPLNFSYIFAQCLPKKVPDSWVLDFGPSYVSITGRVWIDESFQIRSLNVLKFVLYTEISW